MLLVTVLPLRETARNSVCSFARRLHERPECSGEEFFATELLQSSLREAHFQTTPVAGLPTAFRASRSGQRPGPHIALLAEYDALPDIGHGCGHHLIAGAALAAAIQFSASAPDFAGTFSVMGCPAEESLTGKKAMIDVGAFDGVDAALTFHPHAETAIMTSSTGLRKLNIAFQGTAAHASSDPWAGASALDGVLQLFNQVNALRQFVRDRVRIHGVITDGGSAWNVVPEHSRCVIGIRSSDLEELNRVTKRVEECAKAAALATGTTVRVEEEAAAAPLRFDSRLAAMVSDVMVSRGHQVANWEALASTDFGDVSQLLPAVLFSINAWPADVPFHSRRATELGCEPQALNAMIEAGAVMVETSLQLLASPVWEETR